MDEYAGGISTFYEVHGRRLETARRELEALEGDLADLGASDLHELLLATEVRDRVLTARAVVEHLFARRETRWPGYQSRVDFPESAPSWRLFVNSRLEGARVVTITRPVEAAA
jgi:adenylylsulfate reductase subunit A